MNTKTTQSGFMLVGVLIILAAGLVVTASMLKMTAGATKTRALVQTAAEHNYECEETLSKVTAWLQANSKNLVGAFTRANFNNNFVIGAPTIGDNAGQNFQIPSVVTRKNTNSIPMLSNNNFFGVASFPTTTNVQTGAAFDAVAAFRSADLGKANARAMVVWARDSDGDFAPIFRVDAVTGNDPDRGAHMYTYVYTQLSVGTVGGGGGNVAGIGFYTENGDFSTKTGNNICWSHAWTWDGTAWSKGSDRSNCIVASKRTIRLESRINGDARSTLANGVVVSRPNGEVSGTICQGAGCHTMSLPAFATWAATCAGNSQGNFTVASGATVSLASGPNLNQQCWDTVLVQSNGKLILNDTENPYRIKTLKYQNSSNSQVLLPTLPPGQKVTLYVDLFDGGQLNGNMIYNTNNSPCQWEINVTGATSFKLNGTADMHAHFIAPVAPVEVLGNFNFYGQLWAKQIAVTGTGRINSDEGDCTGGSSTAVNDMSVSLRKAGQRYR